MPQACRGTHQRRAHSPQTQRNGPGGHCSGQPVAPEQGDGCPARASVHCRHGTVVLREETLQQLHGEHRARCKQQPSEQARAQHGQQRQGAVGAPRRANPADEPGQPGGHEHHHQHEEHALVEQPRARQVRHGVAEEGHQDRAQRRSEENRDTADVAVEHHGSRDMALQQHIVGRLGVERLQPACDAREHGRNGKHRDVEAVHVIAQEPEALAVFAQPQRQPRAAEPLPPAVQTVQATLMGIVSGRLFGPAGVAIGVVINVLLFFVLAEAVPKTYAVLNPVRGATSTARPISLLVRFWPLRAASAVLIKLTNVIVKGEGLKQGPFIGEQEFLGIVEAAAQESVIEHEERELIESIIEFGDTVVREIMVPRPDAVFIDSDLTITQALDKAVEDGFSRLPVLRKDDDDVDDVVGIVYVKDLVIAERQGNGASPITDLIRQVEVVPENKLVADLMRSMQAKKFHMVMVADEYGIIVGLATLEDCLEELVGEIVDEHDDEDLSLQTLPNGDYLVIGSMPISRLNDELELKVPESEYDTIGGFIFGMLGHVPVQGESVDFDGWRISTETLDGRRIQQVRISALTP